MKAILTIREQSYEIDLDKPLSIGIPLNPFSKGPSCFYAEQPSAKPMIFRDFVCSVEAGAAVNFYTMQFVPHGNGTHTECVGHISPDFEIVNDVIPNPFYVAELISVEPVKQGEDAVITGEQLQSHIQHNSDALVIRTRPNLTTKKTKNYTETNPPYLTIQAMQFIVNQGYQHLLLDLPSVDKEKDDGAVVCHKLFWNISGDKWTHKTITEMIFVDDNIEDGLYILNLQTSNMILDAVPSRPVLYRIFER
jgi:kynurenine formamidase